MLLGDSKAGGSRVRKRTLRSVWRRRARPAWREVRSIVLAGLGLLAVVLGTIGFEQYPHYGLLDSLYGATSLFVFGSPVNPPVPATLQAARILAPILTGYAAVGAILVLSRQQSQTVAIRLFARTHTVIAGMGARGLSLASALEARDMRAVVVESDPTNPHIAEARERGIGVLIGDATDPAVLTKAGTRRARHIVALCGSDATNVNVAAAAAACHQMRRGAFAGLRSRARSSPRTPTGALAVFTHLDDIDLWRSLAEDAATFGASSAGVRPEYFNLDAIGAQALLERHPPFRPSSPDHADRDPRRPHVLIVGLDGVGEPLLLRIARLWRGQSPGPAKQLRVTVAGASAAEDLIALCDRYPALERYCSLDARAIGPIQSAAFQSGRAMQSEDGACDITQAYVCIEDAGQALSAALALHAAPGAVRVPVAVAVADANTGVASILAAEGGRFANVTPFGLLTEATSPELLLRGTNEVLARAKHEEYVRAELLAGNGVERNLSMRPWAELDESIREDNRKFAEGIADKLTVTGCILVPMPLPDPDEPRFEFTAEEVERLARQEHERWMQAKEVDGWRFGTPRHDDRRIHDELVEWERLDETGRDRDRSAVQALPLMLELTGFRIQRSGPPPGALEG